jgi:hypothetical protein
MIPTLPTIFTPSAIDGITWKLDREACPSMYYQSLRDLASIRGDKSNILADMGVLEHLPESLAAASNQQQDAESSHFGRISLALLLLGHGFTDECHNLVTPLSWHQDTDFAHGPSVYASASPCVRAYASYTHSLVHRKESFHVGEFGMVGMDNAHFWSGMVGDSGPEGVERLPHAEWTQAITDLAAGNLNMDKTIATNPRVQAWCREHGLVANAVDAENSIQNYFDSRAMHQLCNSVLQTEPSRLDPQLKMFAEEAVRLEVQILLKSALNLAGVKAEVT